MWRRHKEGSRPSLTQPIIPSTPRSREIAGIGRVTALEIPDQQKFIFWIKNQKNIMDISSAAFTGYKYAPDSSRLRPYFLDPDKIAIILQSESGQIVGFSCAESDTDVPQIAYAAYAAIDPDYQNMGLYDDMRLTLDDTLRKKGYQYKRADVRVKFGLADKLENLYRIIARKNYHDFEANEDMRILVMAL